MEKGSVSVYFVKSALDTILHHGLDPAPLLHDAGISPSLLQAHQARVTAQSFSTLWLGVAKALDDELFGQDSRRMKVGSFALLSQILVNCNKLADAVQRMASFFNLILDDFVCAVEQRDTQVLLTIQGKPDIKDPKVFGFETLLMLQHGLACWLIGRRIPILEASFSYPEPTRSAEYQFMYSRQLTFNCEMTSISFARHYLDLQIVQDERTAKEFVRNAPANIVLKYKNTNSLTVQIRRRLRSYPISAWPAFELVAESFNMTTSTLRRRLSDEGQSFQAIKDDLRRDMAIDYLCYTKLSIEKIALNLGFAETSAFHRAFKKWAGAAPGEYRLQARV